MYYSVLQHVKKSTVWLPVITMQFHHAVLLK